MRCPRCEAPDAEVKDSRSNVADTTIRRRRKCQACAFRFTTFETVAPEDEEFATERPPMSGIRRELQRAACDLPTSDINILVAIARRLRDHDIKITSDVDGLDVLSQT